MHLPIHIYLLFSLGLSNFTAKVRSKVSNNSAFKNQQISYTYFSFFISFLVEISGKMGSSVKGLRGKRKIVVRLSLLSVYYLHFLKTGTTTMSIKQRKLIN